jgi:molybdopterin-guanine dinucleotide biosynthesis protein A
MLQSGLFFDRVARVAKTVFDDVFAVQRNSGPPVSLHDLESPHAARPGFGVACALAHAEARCFVLAVDYPLITTAILRYLRDR